MAFKPARFLKDWPRDAFLPFSAGKYPFAEYDCAPDNCTPTLLQELGHVLDESERCLRIAKHRLKAIIRFFETEGIVTLTTVVSKYKITVTDEPQFAGETFEQRKARVLTVGFGLTVT